MTARALLLATLLLPAARTARADEPGREALRNAAVENLFNLDFEQSRAEIKKFIDVDPKDPFGYLFRSGLIWWQASSEYGLFKDTPTLEGLFESDVNNAVDLSEPLMESKDPKRQADGYFVAGMALGVRGQWNLSRGRYVRAYRDGKKAMKRLKKCVALDPNYHDAYLGLGIFDYQTDRLPGILKVGALLMVRGDAERGKSRIRQAAQMGHLVQRQAAVFLLSLLTLDERDYAGAMPLLRSLRTDYPKSPYFRFTEVVLLNQLQQWEASYDKAWELFQRIDEDPQLLGRKQLSLLCGLPSSRCLDDAVIRGALTWLDKALALYREENGRKRPAGNKNSAAWPAFLHLYRGLAHDILWQRDEAVSDYTQVLELPDAGPIHAWAQRCLQDHCGREEFLGLLKELSLGKSKASDAAVPAGMSPELEFSDSE